jgi:hypothetical protein
MAEPPGSINQGCADALTTRFVAAAKRPPSAAHELECWLTI